MNSSILQHLAPEFEPVAVIWSDTVPADTFQFKKGKFGCVLHLFAEASRRGKTTGGSRESIACNGGRTALGFGNAYIASSELLDRYTALLSKGLKSATDQSAYLARMEASPKSWRDAYEYGERRHCNAELAKEWLLHGVPNYDIQYKYVIFKPLSLTEPDENMRAVIFPVSPIELGALITLAGSVTSGTDPVQVPQGPDCKSISAFVYAQADMAAPRAVLGMWGVEGRQVMHKRFRDDTLTLTLPTPLYRRMEQEADDCVFQTPSWKRISGK